MINWIVYASVSQLLHMQGIWKSTICSTIVCANCLCWRQAVPENKRKTHCLPTGSLTVGLLMCVCVKGKKAQGRGRCAVWRIRMLLLGGRQAGDETHTQSPSYSHSQTHTHAHKSRQRDKSWSTHHFNCQCLYVCVCQCIWAKTNNNTHKEPSKCAESK